MKTDHPLRENILEAVRNPPISLLLFLAYLFLLHPIIFVNLSEINPFDEAVFINRGRLLLSGDLPLFSQNPLTAGFYAITYLPFLRSPYWMVESAVLGRLALLVLVWLSVYLIARQLREFASPFIMPGFLLVTPLVAEFIRFPSDPLFASLAGLAFWQLLSYYNTLSTKHLWLGSAFLGLAALARNDGLLLFLIFLGLVLVLSLRKTRILPTLLPTVLPFFLLVAGYVVLSGAFTGRFDLGTTRRTYDNFEAGQQIIYAGDGDINPVIDSKLEARRLFGTPEENNYSVFAAIRRNPQVYLQRVRAITFDLPDRLLSAYGIRFAAIFLLLGMRGALALIQMKEYRLLIVFLLWPLYSLSGFVITIFRQGHLQFHYYIVYGLAAIGLAALLKNIRSRRERYIWYSVLGVLVLSGLAFDKLAVYLGAVVFLFVLWLIHTVSRQYQRLEGMPAVALLMLLAAGLVLHGNYPPPKVLTLGEDPRERGAIYMAENLPQGTRVAAAAPGVVWMARMDYHALAAPEVPSDVSPDEFLSWLVGQGVEAIYVDHQLYNTNPAIWSLITPHIGDEIERAFTADNGDIQVLILKTDR